VVQPGYADADPDAHCNLYTHANGYAHSDAD
jgi:hypothetical protein